MIRTNTFASNTVSLDMPWEAVQENIRQGYRLAYEVAQPKNIYIAADIGQIPYDNQANRDNVSKEYVEICRTFLEEGAEIFVFETFSDLEDIREAIEFIGEQAFIILQPFWPQCPQADTACREYGIRGWSRFQLWCRAGTYAADY